MLGSERKRNYSRREVYKEKIATSSALQCQVLGQPCMISIQRLKKASWRKGVKVRYRHKNILGKERCDGHFI